MSVAKYRMTEADVTFFQRNLPLFLFRSLLFSLRLFLHWVCRGRPPSTCACCSGESPRGTQCSRRYVASLFCGRLIDTVLRPLVWSYVTVRSLMGVGRRRISLFCGRSVGRHIVTVWYSVHSTSPTKQRRRMRTGWGVLHHTVLQLDSNDNSASAKEKKRGRKKGVKRK